MNTLEMVQAVTKDMKEKGQKVTQETTREFVASLEKTVDGAVLSGDSVTVMGVKFASKVQKGREGIISVGTKKGESFKTEDKIVPTAKILGSKREALTR